MTDERPLTLADLIETARGTRSYAAVARELDIRETTLANWRGVGRAITEVPPPERAAKYAEGLGVSLRQFVEAAYATVGYPITRQESRFTAALPAGTWKFTDEELTLAVQFVRSLVKVADTRIAAEESLAEATAAKAAAKVPRSRRKTTT